MPKTAPSPVVSTVALRGAGGAPCGPPISVMPGRPLSVHGAADAFTIVTALKVWPAVPLDFMGTSVSSRPVQGDGAGGRVVVVVVDDVLVDVVAGALVVVVAVVVVVEVDDEGGGTVVVVVDVAALEHPPTSAETPSKMASPPTTMKFSTDA